MVETDKETEKTILGNEQKETIRQEEIVSKEEKNNPFDLSAEAYTLDLIGGKAFLKSENSEIEHYICPLTREVFYDRNMILNNLMKETPDQKKEESLTKRIVSGMEADPEILGKISKHIKSYIYCKDGRVYPLLATYVALTYYYKLFERIPYLWLNGSKGSGKTALINVMSDLVHNAEKCASISTSALFRLVDEEDPTLFIDEAELLEKRGKSNHELLQVLNSGYERGGKAIRVIQFEAVSYSAFCPKIIAGINKLNATLMDRCIKVKMQKSPNGVILYRAEEHLSEIDHFKRELNLSLPKIIAGLETFRNSAEYGKVCSILKNRDFDRWFPLLAIAFSFRTESVDLFSDILNLASEELEQRKIEKSHTPEEMCRKIVSEYAKLHPSLKENKSNTLYFRADDIRNEVMEKDTHNDYTNIAEVTKVLTRMGTRRIRLRIPEFGKDAVQIYIFDEEFFQKNENEEG